MSGFNDILEAEKELKKAVPKYDFSGFKVFENDMLEDNEIIIVCGKEAFKIIAVDKDKSND